MIDTNFTALPDPGQGRSLQHGIDWLMAAPPEALMLFFAFVVGYAFRRMPFIPNSWVYPFSIAAGAVPYVGLAVASWPADKPLVYNITRSGVVGFVLGVAGATLAVALHNKVLGPLADKFPLLKVLVQVDEDTGRWTKKDFKPEPTNDKDSKPPITGG